MTGLKPAAVFIGLSVLACAAVAQTAVPALSGDQIVDRVAPSVVLVLVGDETGRLTGVGSGLIVRPDGVLLTAYHGVKGAKTVQVRLKSGDVYDRVSLVAVDERRDIAALRITANNLPPLEVLQADGIKAGTPVYVIANGAALPWSASAGVLSSMRMADDVPGAGSGYRVFQFTAPISPGSSGGVLVDTQGRAIGIVIATLTDAQNVNFAIPLDAVFGLTAQPGGAAFASGAALQMPKNDALPASPVVKAEAIARAPAPASAAAQPSPAFAGKYDAADDLNSKPIETRDPQALLRAFRSVYVDSHSTWLKSPVMKSAIHKRKEFGQWGIAVVDEPRLADMVLNINLVGGTEDYTFELQHQNTSIVVTAGKVRGFTPILWMSGNAAAPKIADALIKAIRAAGRTDASSAPRNDAPKKNKKDKTSS